MGSSVAASNKRSLLITPVVLWLWNAVAAYSCSPIPRPSTFTCLLLFWHVLENVVSAFFLFLVILHTCWVDCFMSVCLVWLTATQTECDGWVHIA